MPTTTFQPSFTVTQKEAAIIEQIADRAVAIATEAGCHYDHLEASMDVTACHCNGCPLRLQELLEADDFNFTHDVFGIRRFIDRTTGEMPGAKFHPRFSVPRTESTS